MHVKRIRQFVLFYLICFFKSAFICIQQPGYPSGYPFARWRIDAKRKHASQIHCNLSSFYVPSRNVNKPKTKRHLLPFIKMPSNIPEKLFNGIKQVCQQKKSIKVEKQTNAHGHSLKTFKRAIFCAVCLLCFGRCLLKQTFLYFPFIII